MPTISFFYGITIFMYLSDKEHEPPHIHAFYQDDGAAFSILDGTIIKGKFPTNGKKLVKEFIQKYKQELLAMWNTGTYHKLPPLK
ncbi:MAG: DUF4160 domain-containing protein [bacterium]|nr:DUF4160 domain-containing protein [bacterium]